MCCSWRFLFTQICTHLICIHTTGAHVHHTHTYNILPCFESIRGSAQSPLHELFVINERARWLLLWWLSERTQLCHRELRKQHQLLVNTVCALFIWLPEYVSLFLFGPQHIHLLWMDQTAVTSINHFTVLHLFHCSSALYKSNSKW